MRSLAGSFSRAAQSPQMGQACRVRQATFPPLRFVIVYAIVDDALSPDFPLGDAVETFLARPVLGPPLTALSDP